MTSPRRRADLVVGELHKGEETAVFDPGTGQVVSLNPTAAAVWYLCDGTRDEAALAGELARAYPDADSSMVHADVRRILDELTTLGLFA